MKILGIDTTTKILCLGLAHEDKVYEYGLEVGTRLSAVLAPTINRALCALNWKPDDIDYFACGLGPGSFTGIRIGLATIKGLSWSLNIPAIGIPTLDLLAQNASFIEGFVIAVIDARRDLIYCCFYRAHRGIIKRVSPYMLLSVEELLKRIKQKINRSVTVVLLGDAIPIVKDKLSAAKFGIDILDKDYWGLKPGNIIVLAQQKIKSKDFSKAVNIEPIYLYPKECQIKK
jgi:tRNA threonylcarbamoyladenosine biosynthesis protein TsaB